jgi:hypothetical protein
MRSHRTVGQRHVGDQGGLEDEDQDQQEDAHGSSPEGTRYFYHLLPYNAVRCVTRAPKIVR